MQTQGSTSVQVSFVATYPPQQCGIGTFTADLVGAVATWAGVELADQNAPKVIALTDLAAYDYGPEVCFKIRTQEELDYGEAAYYLNHSRTDVVCVQHEARIYGGTDGAHLLTLLQQVKKPVVTTLHNSVIPAPSNKWARMIRAICDRSTFVVVLTHKARALLSEVYGVPAEKVVHIPHGVPNVPFIDPEHSRIGTNLIGRRVILTFGLLHPLKGLETAIDAMAKIVPVYPDLVYIILGVTHPLYHHHVGEAYRLSLRRRVQLHNLADHVIFLNQFATLTELVTYLQMADLYISPYLLREQVASGTLAYAMACGKAIVATPYWYAEEVLADGRGVLVPFRDSEAMSSTMAELLSNDADRFGYRMRAYEYARQMIWPEVAAQYMSVFQRALLPIGLQTTGSTTGGTGK